MKHWTLCQKKHCLRPPRMDVSGVTTPNVFLSIEQCFSWPRDENTAFLEFLPFLKFTVLTKPSLFEHAQSSMDPKFKYNIVQLLGRHHQVNGFHVIPLSQNPNCRDLRPLGEYYLPIPKGSDLASLTYMHV